MAITLSAAELQAVAVGVFNSRASVYDKRAVAHGLAVTLELDALAAENFERVCTEDGYGK